PSSPDLPPPPDITVTPEKTEYLIGDTVAIECKAPWAKKIQGFQFSGTSGWAVDVRTTRKTYVYRFNVTGPKDGGAHACTYAVVNQFRQILRSRESKAVVISVKDRPPQPTLLLTSPSRVTVEGQPLVFLCAAPAAAAEQRFQFYNGKMEVTGGAEVVLGNGEAKLRLPRSDGNHTGNFTCRYEEKTEGRWIRSYLSRAVEILVKAPAPPPRLRVDPASGVVSEDDPVRLTCVASRADFALKFRFYRNGAEIPAGRAPSQSRHDGGNFSRLFGPPTPRSFGGRFSCGVEEEVGGAWVPAPRSEGVDVAVKGRCPPSPPAA
ncbi:FCRL5 protein, partial [Mesembrinibis cayennensis]|nr:FCRL5 protein [Mesembrinibis cayennensis]